MSDIHTIHRFIHSYSQQTRREVNPHGNLTFMIRVDKDVAVQMRRSGLSYRELHAKLKIPKSTLSDWFSNKDWSNEIKARLDQAARLEHGIRIRELDRIRGINLEKVYAEARSEAREEFGALKYDPLFIAGIMLYWGEGDKRSRNQVRITNTDPELIRLYVCFLLRACRIPVERISAHVLIYPDHEAAVCREYWAKTSNIPIAKFTKCTTIKGRHKTHRLPYGICMVVVSSTYLKEKVNEWLNILPMELMQK